jgi:hypothetical protein
VTPLSSSRTDLAHVYTGLNYLLLGDRLKLMTCAEYSVMHDSAQDGGDFDGWTYLAGARLYF